MQAAVCHPPWPVWQQQRRSALQKDAVGRFDSSQGQSLYPCNPITSESVYFPICTTILGYRTPAAMGRKFIRSCSTNRLEKFIPHLCSLTTYRPACKFGWIPPEMSGMVPRRSNSPGTEAVPMAACASVAQLVELLTNSHCGQGKRRFESFQMLKLHQCNKAFNGFRHPKTGYISQGTAYTRPEDP